MRPIILLPSYKPDEKLLTCLESLVDEGFDEFLIVDDGSGQEYKHLFDKAKQQYKGCTVIRHAVNLGKGRALKTGFNYALNHYEGSIGLVACDSDGQHPASAVKRVADAMIEHPDKLILGTRMFLKGDNVPIANFLGNTITKGVFKLLSGMTFGDTQCGLRAYPKVVMEKLLTVKGERFEYENIMLLSLRENQIGYYETPMEAIYIEENQTSHFNKVKDSFRIYMSLLSYAALPIFAGVVSFILTMIFFATLPMCSLIKPALFYATGILVGWLILIMPMPENKTKGFTIIYPILHTLIVSTLFYWLYNYQAMYFYGSWWLTAIIAAPLAYTIYLRLRFGKRPIRIKEK